MKVGLMIRDVEYRDALVNNMSNYDNNLYVKIIETNIKDASGCVILTDVLASELDDRELSVLKNRTVFIVDTKNDVKSGLYTIFKYCNIHEMLSKLSFVFNSWHGLTKSFDHSTKLISVCCESDSYSSECCRALARQIIYLHGGSALIIPLSYINDYGLNEKLHENNLSRLFYTLQSRRNTDFNTVTYTDSYGVSSLLISNGNNPIAYLDDDELKALISGLSKGFDTIIADVSTCFRSENISVMKSSDNVVYFDRGRRQTGIEDLPELCDSERLTRIRLTGGTEDIIAIDDCVMHIYGESRNENIPSRNNM